MIEALPLAEELDLAAVPPGVADWHHVLIAETGPADRGWPEPEPRCWRIEGVSPLRGPVERLLPAGPQALPAALVFLPEDPDDVAVGLLVAAARRAVTEGVPLVVIDQGETASGFLATICPHDHRIGNVAR